MVYVNTYVITASHHIRVYWVKMKVTILICIWMLEEPHCHQQAITIMNQFGFTTACKCVVMTLLAFYTKDMALYVLLVIVVVVVVVVVVVCVYVCVCVCVHARACVCVNVPTLGHLHE